MPSTYLDLTCHVVFSTKNRNPWIRDAWRKELHAYLGGIAKGLGAAPITIGGVEDHVHLLLGLRGTHALADVVREIKKASNAWVGETMGMRHFAWQEGYAGFSVSADHKKSLIQYIGNQEAHHKMMSSIDELVALLKEAGIEFNPSYLD